jgi:hypothetical protein
MSPDYDPRQPVATAWTVAIYRLQHRIAPRLKHFDGHQSTTARAFPGELAGH